MKTYTVRYHTRSGAMGIVEVKGKIPVKAVDEARKRINQILIRGRHHEMFVIDCVEEDGIITHHWA